MTEILTGTTTMPPDDWLDFVTSQLVNGPVETPTGPEANAWFDQIIASATPTPKVREYQAERQAEQDVLFKQAPTDTSRLRRLNQIREEHELKPTKDVPPELVTFDESEEELLRMIAKSAEPRGFYQTTMGNTLPGLVARGITRAVYGEGTEAPPGDFGYAGNMASMIGSFVLDPVTYAGGWAGKALTLKASEQFAAQLAGRGAIATAERLAVRGIAPATTLAAITATHDPLEQYIHTGNVDLLQTARETAKSAIIGEALGPASAAGKFAIPAEIATFATVGPALEGRVPNEKDVADAISMVIGFRLVHLMSKAAKRLLTKDYEERRAVGQADPVPNRETRKKAGIEDATRKETAAAIDLIKQEEADARAIRSDQAEVPQPRVQRPGGEAARGEDIQRPTEAGGEARYGPSQEVGGRTAVRFAEPRIEALTGERRGPLTFMQFALSEGFIKKGERLPKIGSAQYVGLKQAYDARKASGRPTVEERAKVDEAETFDFGYNVAAQEAQKATITEGPGIMPKAVSGLRKPRKTHPAADYWPTEIVARRIEQARGVDRDGLANKLRRIATEAWGKTFRPQEFLPKKEEFASANEFFRLLKDVGRASADEAVRRVGTIINVLDANGLRLFADKLIVENQLAALERGEPLRFGFESRQAIEATKTAVDALVDASPSVRDALATRHAIVQELVGKLVHHGLLPETAMKNAEAYFHQQVTMQLTAERLGGAGTPQMQKRAFQKRRTLGEELGKEFDYNTSYIEAETKWMTDALIELRKKELLDQFIERPYDVHPTLTRRAKAKNFEAAVGGAENVRRIHELRAERNEINAMLSERAIDRSEVTERLSAISEELARLDPTEPARRKMAIGFRQLGVDAETGDTVDFREIGRLANEGNIGALTILKGKNECDTIIEQEAGKAFVTWHDLIPKDHDVWQPRPGNLFYKAFSIPERLAEAIQKQELDGLKLEPDQVRVVMAMGGARKQYVLPRPIVEQLNRAEKRAAGGELEIAQGQIMRSWKVWTLLSPKRAVAYMLRNMTGDIDPVLGGAIGTISETKTAISHLHRYASGDVRLPRELVDARDLGVINSSMTAQEIPDLKDLKVFRDLYETKYSVTKMPLRLVESYFQQVKGINEFRENTLRYAAYRYYLKGLQAGTIKHYGGANKSVVRALQEAHGNKVAAAHLARNLLGDYGNLTVLGNWQRAKLIPFYSWMEVNVKRYPRMAINAAEWGIAKGKGNPWATTVYTAAGLSAIASLYAAQWSWNNLLWPSKERDLDTWDQQNPHVVVCRNDDGSVNVFRNFGALGDALEWFGINTLLFMLAHYESDQITGMDIVKAMAKDPVNKVIQGVGPQYKIPIELVSGESVFPDVFNWRTQSRDEAIPAALGLRDEYREVKGRLLETGERARPHYLQRTLVGIIDPRKTALHRIHDLRSRFEAMKGRKRLNINALSSFRPMRLAAENDDYPAFKEALSEYLKNHTGKNFNSSLKFLDPLSARMRDDWEREFEHIFLNPRQREDLKVARDYAAVLKLKMIDWWHRAAEEQSE